jgi:hypothetical protein
MADEAARRPAEEGKLAHGPVPRATINPDNPQ